MINAKDKIQVSGTVYSVNKFPILTNVALRDQNGIQCYFCVKSDKNTYSVGDEVKNLKGIVRETYEKTNRREFQYAFKVVK